MFLTNIGLFQLFKNIVNCIFTYVTNVLIKILNFPYEKRAVASSGFYIQLLQQINNLQSLLNTNELLEINNSNNGNIYTLIYENKTRRKECAGFKEPSDDLFNDIKKLSLEIKNTFNISKENVYPKDSIKTRWYSSQQKLLNFCEFMENKSMRGITNIAKVDGEYKHIVECRDLINAMNYIKESIEKGITDSKF